MDQGFGVKALIEKEDQVLVLFKADGTLDFPGGRVETVESFLCALYREVLEETGLSIQILDVLAQWGFVKQRRLYISGLTFKCRAPSVPITLSKEHRGFAVMDKEEALKDPSLQRFLGIQEGF